MPSQNHYQCLGLSKTATLEEVNKAYRKKALTLHPDKIRQEENSDEAVSQATEAFKALQEAHEILSCPEKRAAYDQGQEENSNPHCLDVPEGLERPSQNWHRLREMLADQYKAQD